MDSHHRPKSSRIKSRLTSHIQEARDLENLPKIILNRKLANSKKVTETNIYWLQKTHQIIRSGNVNQIYLC